MNLDRVVFWIRLISWAILDVLNNLDGDPGSGPESLGDGPPSGFKPERIQVWIGIFARAALKAVDEVGAPPPEADNAAVQRAPASFWPTFKPERIQFWFRLIASFVLAVVDGLSEETGKSGEPSGAPDSEAGW